MEIAVMPKALRDLTGQKFNKLTVIEQTPNKTGKVAWFCRCDCGGIITALSCNITCNRTKSCGCLNLVSHVTTHGLSKTSEYRVWAHVISRTTNPSAEDYSRYGGRGITICNRWRKFEAFIEDMGKRPSDDHSIDRIDNEKGYYPDNCRWATRIEQARNKRNNVHITIDGVTNLLTDWLKISPVYNTTYYKRKKRGFSDRDALGL